jgi:hypothetical protein
MGKVTADVRRRARERNRLRIATAREEQQVADKRARALEKEAKKALPKQRRRRSKVACNEREAAKIEKIALFQEALDWCAAKDKGARACTKLSLSKTASYHLHRSCGQSALCVSQLLSAA